MALRDWCIIYLLALQLVGKVNTLRDQLSRDRRELHKWSLKRSVTSKIFALWVIDRFAKRHNAR